MNYQKYTVINFKIHPKKKRNLSDNNLFITPLYQDELEAFLIKKQQNYQKKVAQLKDDWLYTYHSRKKKQVRNTISKFIV